MAGCCCSHSGPSSWDTPLFCTHLFSLFSSPCPSTCPSACPSWCWTCCPPGGPWCAGTSCSLRAPSAGHQCGAAWLLRSTTTWSSSSHWPWCTGTWGPSTCTRRPRPCLTCWLKCWSACCSSTSRASPGTCCTTKCPGSTATSTRLVPEFNFLLITCDRWKPHIYNWND